MTKKKQTLVISELGELSLKEKIKAVWQMSVPGILAQISEIAMQYIDAAMVGSLGASASASIGLVASSTWLMGGLISGSAAGFYVQIAHASGAGDYAKAKRVLQNALFVCGFISLGLAFLGTGISSRLPYWLGGNADIVSDAGRYFFVYAAFIPVRMLYFLSLGALQCTGNMKTPSIISAVMCGLDVLFNALLIFPNRTISPAGLSLTVPGAGLGVAGAALGTAFSFVCAGLIMAYEACWKSPVLSLREREAFHLEKHILQEAWHIGFPMALEQSAMCAAQVYSTRIVAPLGTEAIAANSFAVTAEALCYMPGYGIQSASTSIVGQAFGAKRKDLAKSFAWLTTLMGMAIMTLTGGLMYVFCPYVFAFLTPVKSVQKLGTKVLRIELLAEPMFAASIVASGGLRGAGDTLIPGLMDLVSIWGIRITLASYLAPRMGLPGVWTAMALELTFRGIIFLIRLGRGKWLER